MYFGIAQALQFSIVGIPYFGVETCGFNYNADLELCTKWMQLSAWFPLYRNHDNRNTIAQEAYRWATNAESTRRIMNIRYSTLPYTYTLFRKAHTAGETVLRALAWEFPDDESLKAVETQFMSGPALLVTPVLEPLATTVKGVFPGVKDGTRWYDWYTLDEVDATPGENKTLDAPLVHQPIHIRGGYIIPISIRMGMLRLKFTKNTLTSKATGSYDDHLPIANITVVGLKNSLGAVHMTLGKKKLDISGATLNSSSTSGNLHYTYLEAATKAGIWCADFTLSLSY
ncbi:hypothetical protein Daus18300_004565 [Diaporthe australafricana]|uniref:alpha-glucosidase n=1 Tax=Diaporthe australafricana TaxID=127596 RepID=A0ABR3X7M7_9PEZI